MLTLAVRLTVFVRMDVMVHMVLALFVPMEPCLISICSDVRHGTLLTVMLLQSCMLSMLILSSTHSSQNPILMSMASPSLSQCTMLPTTLFIQFTQSQHQLLILITLFMLHH